MRWFYIKLGMRVYLVGIILRLDFRVTGSKVTGHAVKKRDFGYGGPCTKSMGI